MKCVRLGISPCPNDTFAFHGLLTGAVRPRGFELAIELADIEELNRRLLSGELDAAKGSFALALGARGRFRVLSAGSALGRGVGPVVLARSGTDVAAARRVLAPGEHTTAALLWRLFHARGPALEHVVFSRIMPAVAHGDADLGVCIHEGRFTYRDWGLELVEDLGATWERAERLPLPLGGVLCDSKLDHALAVELAAAVRESIEFARAHPNEALATMRAHAQEHADDVLWRHVELYVSAETERLSAEGQRALDALMRRASEAGLLDAAPLSIVGG